MCSIGLMLPRGHVQPTAPKNQVIFKGRKGDRIHANSTMMTYILFADKDGSLWISKVLAQGKKLQPKEPKEPSGDTRREKGRERSLIILIDII